MLEFEGKTAVVTGAASGIGLGLAQHLARAGMRVVLADVEEKALAEAVRGLERGGHRVLGVVTDTMRRESLERLRDRAIEAFGKVHVLCNNAGVASLGETRPVWEIPDGDWTWVLGVNFFGVLYGLQVFVPHMLAHGEEGHIVNTASLAGLMPGAGAYGVSKHGVLALSEGLHRNLRERDARIGASVLCPGFVNTRIFDAERNRPAGLATGRPVVPDEAMAAGRAMLEQGKQPAEIADIVFESIREGRFYILPHPAWDEFVRRRVECVLARGEPATLDFAEMMRRRAAGERF
jgi:NAD(P)-dependent dehydrogenase (short-subunit alcohol dehydrogenase family)